MGIERTQQGRKEAYADAGTDVVFRYMSDVEGRERLAHEAEVVLVREMIRCREEIADLLRAVLLKACDVLGIDDNVRGRAKQRRYVAWAGRSLQAYVAEIQQLRAPEEAQARAVRGPLRSAIAGLVDKARLRSLEAKIASLAERARCELDTLRRNPSSVRARTAAKRALAAIDADFGVSADELEFVAAAVAAKRGHVEAAKRRLIESNLRLVVYFARRAQWPCAELADLIQEGNIALMNAVDSFDPDRGLAFGTFATIAVQRAIHRFGAAAADLVRVPESVRLLRRRVQQAADYLAEEGVAPSWDEVAAYLEIPTTELLGALEDATSMLSLDAAIEEELPLSGIIADATAIDAEAALAGQEQEKLVREEISRLEARRRRVIEARYDLEGVGPSNLAEIGREFGLTRERARQIEAQALRALRTREYGSRRDPRKRLKLQGSARRPSRD